MYKRELPAVWLATQLFNLLLSPHDPGWLGVQPHPYLIPLALVGCRYGTRAALLLAALLAGEYAVLSHGASPFLFPQAAFYASCLVTASVCGWLFDHSRQRQRELQAELQQSRLELAQSQQQREVLEKAVGELRQRILGQGETFGSLYELARRLTTLQPEQLYAASLELACQRSEAAQGHFYREHEGRFEALAHYPAGAKPAMQLAHSQVVRQALQHGRLLTAPQAEGKLSPLEPMVVMPLGGGALIVLEDLPFERYHPTTLGVLQSIGDWTTRALEQLAVYDEKESRLHQGQSARARVLGHLRERPLLESELPLVENMLLPWDSEVLDLFRQGRWETVLRENLLQLLERHPDSLPEGLRALVSEERGWVALTAREAAAWEGHPGGVSMRAHLREHLETSRRQLLRLALLVEPTELDVFSGPSVGLRDWCQGLLEEVFPESGAVEVELEELLLEALDHADRRRRTAALRTLGVLIEQDARWGEPGPGRPIEYAREMASDAHAEVRAAAQAIVGSGGGCASG